MTNLDQYLLALDSLGFKKVEPLGHFDLDAGREGEPPTYCVRRGLNDQPDGEGPITTGVTEVMLFGRGMPELYSAVIFDRDGGFMHYGAYHT